MAFFTSFSFPMFHLHASLLFHLPFFFPLPISRSGLPILKKVTVVKMVTAEIGCAGARETRERRRLEIVTPVRERRPPERVKDADERGTRTVVVMTGGYIIFLIKIKIKNVTGWI
jgi:hypothetical protein